LRVVDATSGLPLGPPMNGHTAFVTHASFTRDGRRIATGSDDNSIRIWDSTTGEQIGAPLTGHTDFVSAVEFSPDGGRLVSSDGDGSVRLWDIATGREITPPLLGQSTPRWVRSLAFSPDGTRLAAIDTDKNMWLWDPATREQIGHVRVGSSSGTTTALVFTPDSKQLVTADDSGLVTRWNSVDGTRSGDPVKIHTGGINAVALTPDGTRLALSVGETAEESEVEIWDAVTGKRISPLLIGHEDRVNGLLFTPDGTWLASGGEDGTVRLWDTALPGTVHDRFCREHGVLSADEWNFYAPGEPRPDTC
jgi:WD40 repeat protein